MSVAIATMGKFTPATGGGTTIVERIVEVGSSDGWEAASRPQKPVVIVSRLHVDQREKKDISVEVVSISEE